MYILGIDIGTTKIAGILLQTSDPTSVEVLAEDNRASLLSPYSWEHRQNPETILQINLAIIDKLKCRAKRPIRSIGISSQMHGFLYVDKHGNACSSLFTWQDSRAAILLESGGLATAQSLIQEKTGHSIFQGYALATHYYNWLKGLVPQNVYKIVRSRAGIRHFGLNLIFMEHEKNQRYEERSIILAQQI